MTEITPPASVKPWTRNQFAAALRKAGWRLMKGSVGGTAESMALWTGEHLAGLASPVETDEDVLIDLMLQRVPLSVESIRLKVEFVEPRLPSTTRPPF